jgi:hypothetical protein
VKGSASARLWFEEAGPGRWSRVSSTSRGGASGSSPGPRRGDPGAKRATASVRTRRAPTAFTEARSSSSKPRRDPNRGGSGSERRARGENAEKRVVERRTRRNRDRDQEPGSIPIAASPPARLARARDVAVEDGRLLPIGRGIEPLAGRRRRSNRKDVRSLMSPKDSARSSTASPTFSIPASSPSPKATRKRFSSSTTSVSCWIESSFKSRRR